MPIAPTYPGVYIEEIPSGVRTIAGVGTSVTAFVGFTVEGPVNDPVRILSFGDYERVFGGLHPDSEVGFAVQHFFLNGGTEGYVVRVAQGFQTASVSMRVGATTVLKVSAASPGTWGNRLRLDVDYATGNPDSTFNLVVTRLELRDGVLQPAGQEVHRNLSMNAQSPNYAAKVVNTASRWVQVERPGGLAFGASGFSLSGRHAAVPALSASTTALTVGIDGTTTATLNLAIPPVPPDLNAVVGALTAAIAAAGLAARLSAARVDALGAASPTGEYLRLTSSDTTERSSVTVLGGGPNDASGALKLGLFNGGREKEGASSARPLPTGSLTTDLADLLGTNVSGSLDLTVNDNSSGAPVAIVPTQTRPLPATAVGTALRDAVRAILASFTQPELKGATVELNGTQLRIVPAALTPNASMVLGGTAGTAMRFTAGGTNVQQYALGVGANFSGQLSAVAGVDGTAPSNPNDLIGDVNAKTGMQALRQVDLFNLLVIPRTSMLADPAAKAVLAAADALCQERRAFLIVDPDPTRVFANVGDYVNNLNLRSRNAGVFFPQALFADPTDGLRPRAMPASGAIAGLFARTDSERGVWKAPAGIEAVLRGVQGLAIKLTDRENGVLNPLGINCLRTFPVTGHVAWGARTLRGADSLADEYKYIPVRRLALYVEESLFRGLQWVVFEPNDEPLWAQIRLNVGAFMHDLFRQGAFQGQTPRDAYFVKCDRETTTQNDIDRGIVNILVGFAPLKPAEFVVVKLQQMAGQIQT
ncbi:MAG: phage tail sheath subtilisin-like domain-containing protein [Verrucomicrobiales bacterium]|nr:phage tail sheath subtilisin-like domain-containing protein [Verrucomicrobiales bacterium]